MTKCRRFLKTFSLFDQGGSTSGGYSSELNHLLDEDVDKTLHIKVGILYTLLSCWEGLWPWFKPIHWSDQLWKDVSQLALPWFIQKSSIVPSFFGPNRKHLYSHSFSWWIKIQEKASSCIVEQYFSLVK